MLDEAAMNRIAKERVITGMQTMSRNSNAKHLAVKWIALSNAAKNDSLSATQDAFQALLVELTNMEMQGKKLAAVEAAQRRELESFGNKRQQLAADVQQAKELIEHKKKQLAEAQQWRKQQEEHEMLRHQIMKLPSKEDTRRQISSVQEEISKIQQDIASHQHTYQVVSKKVAAVKYLIEDLLASFPQLDGHTGGGGGDGQADGPQPMQLDS